MTRRTRSRLSSPIVRMVDELIKADGSGLMPYFLRLAIMTFARDIDAANPDKISEVTGGFVSGHERIRCAQQILERRDQERLEVELRNMGGAVD
jgi:hypothetical protein